ncbi:MAG: TonB family protein [Bdellovibrionales bacterium]|nr:TonB family protein [Bdellovibrionales bacterium]
MSVFKNRFILFIFLSLSLHLLGVFSLNFASLFTSQDNQDQEVVTIEYVEPQKQPKQIVEQKGSINEEIDPEAEFLSEKNQKVKEQTQAKNKGYFKNGQTGKPQPQKEANNHKSLYEKNKAKFSNNPFAPKLELQKMAKSARQRQGTPNATDDHLKDIALGMETYLNTREYVYYTYYNRIKSQLRQYWGPNVRKKVEALVRQGRFVASTSSRVTKLVIVLNNKGDLVKIQVMDRSGLRDLDDAAIEAFRAAAPFPNPPKGMVEKDGKIRIKWDFILEA